MNTSAFDKFEQFIRGADSQSIFSDAERFELIAYGILKQLSDQPSSKSYELINLFILQSTDPALISDGFNVLVNAGKRGDQQAIESLFTLYLSYGNKQAAEFIQKEKFLSSFNCINAAFYLLTNQLSQLYALKRPLYFLQGYYRKASAVHKISLLGAAQKASLQDWTGTLQCLENLSPATFEEGLQIYNSLPTSGKRFFLGQLIYQIITKKPHALEYALLVFYHSEEPILQHILTQLSSDQFPPKMYALFLLIDEQWSAYQQFDPSSKYLQQIYQETENPIRVKILQKTRLAGIDFVLSGQSRHQKTLGINDLTYDDWQAILQSQIDNQQSQMLWQLAQIAPPFWTQKILNHLQSINWYPELPEEKAFFEALLQIKPVPPGQENQSLFVPIKSFSYHMEFQQIAVQDNILAAYSKKDQTIFVYHPFEAARPELTKIIPPRPLLPVLIISNDQKYLLWADVDQYISIYDLQRERIIKRFAAHKNIIKDIVLSSDQRHLFSVGFDGSLQAWRFPDGIHEKTIWDDHNEIYSLVLSSMDNFLLAGNIKGEIHVFSANKMDYLHTLNAGDSPITLLSNPVNGQIASCSSADKISFGNYRSNKVLNQHTNLSVQGKLNQIKLSENGQQILLTTVNGIITLIDSLSGKLYETLSLEDSPILKIHAIDQFLWIFQRNGNAQMMNQSIWQQILSPAKQTGQRRLSQLDDLLSLPHLTTFQKTWLEFTKSLIHWQKRYDINIEEINTPISIDDYSITI